MKNPLAVIAALMLSLVASPAEPQPVAPNGPLKIVVVAGEGAVNIIQQKTAVSPIVEIRDRNDLPVVGATVTFAISGGKNAAFAGGAQTMTVTTNAAGRAAAAALNPLSNGPVQIQVSAAFQGQTAAATVGQTNVATAAQAGPTGSGGSGGGGLSATTIGLLAAAVGGGAVAIKTSIDAGETAAPTLAWMITTFANGSQITPCRSPATTCELRVSDNTAAGQLHIDMTGIDTSVPNTLEIDCGGCFLNSGFESHETFSMSNFASRMGYVPVIRYSGVGVFPLQVRWLSGGAPVLSFSILVTVVP